MRLIAGEAGRLADFERAFAALQTGDVDWLRDRTDRRRVARSHLPDGTPCLVKHFLAPARHRLREALKRLVRLDGARREWRALERLHAGGQSVPRPLAHVRLPGREDVLLTEWIEGPTLRAALETPDVAERRRLLESAGAAVLHLHRSGWIHGDLHRSNLLLSERGWVMVDLASASRRARARARYTDLGLLELSLRTQLSPGGRLRLRAAALGARRPFDAAEREALRAVGRAGRRRQQWLWRGRALRGGRAGRRALALRAEGGAGLIAAGADESAVREALAGRGSGELLVRRLAGAASGGAARRGWRLSFALAAAGVPHAEPVAFVEWRRLGIPRSAALVLGVPGTASPSLEERVKAWARLWARLHANGFRTPSPDPAELAFTRSDRDSVARLIAPERLALPVLPPNLPPDPALDELERAWRAEGATAEQCRRGRAAYLRARVC